MKSTASKTVIIRHGKLPPGKRADYRRSMKTLTDLIGKSNDEKQEVKHLKLKTRKIKQTVSK